MLSAQLSEVTQLQSGFVRYPKLHTQIHRYVESQQQVLVVVLSKID